MEDVLNANQLHKASGSTLPFKEWLNREKAKGTFIKNDTLASIQEDAKKDFGITTNEDELNQKSAGKIFGINKSVVIISAVIIIAAIGVKIYRAKK